MTISATRGRACSRLISMRFARQLAAGTPRTSSKNGHSNCVNSHTLLITRSEQGMTIYTPDARHHVDAQAKEVFDVSGAGDTVLATLAVTKGAGLDWVDSMYWANRAGGIVVGKLGTSVVTAQELQ